MTFCKSNVLAFAPTSILLKGFMFLSSPTLISVVSSDDDFMFLKNFPCSVFINSSRAGYKRWIIGSVDWKGTRNSWKSWATKATNNTYASMICLLKADLIRKYLCVFSTSFLKFFCGRNLRKYSFKYSHCSKQCTATCFILTQQVSACFSMYSVMTSLLMVIEV